MKTVGACLIVTGAALLELGVRSYFDWKVPILGLVFVILCIVFFACGVTFAAIGLVRNERDKNLFILRPHFDNFRQRYNNIIPDCKVDEARIYSPNSSMNIFTDPLPLDFTAHFPEINRAWHSCSRSIITHNGEYEAFLRKIKDYFTLVGLKWIEETSCPESPGISWRIYDPLLIWWNCRYNHLANCTVDFAKVGSDIVLQGQLITDTNKLYVSGYGRVYIAYFDNESDNNKCQNAIKYVAFNSEYEKGAANLIHSASDLVKSVSELKSSLTNSFQNIDTNWPIIGTYWSTKDYRFSRLNNCPKCRLLPR